MSRFGGHETFAVREGWFTKSLEALKADKDLFKDPLACDRLGVGRNMAKSIRHWLQVAELVNKGNRKVPLEISEVGKLIMRKDRYFLRAGTWWAIHINIVTCDTDAVAWKWFFNRAYTFPFDRMSCSSDMLRQLTIEGKKPPSRTTLNNDISCLLSSYAVSIPPANRNPEEAIDSPLQALGLVTHLRETDTYLANRKRKKIPPAIVGYAFAKSIPSTNNDKHITKPLSQIFALQNGPSKMLVLDHEALLDTLQEAETGLGADFIHVELSGDERTVRFKNLMPIKWLTKYYEDVEE